MQNTISFVEAKRTDVPNMARIIKDMAHFEKLESEIAFTLPTLESEYFDKKAAIFIFLELGDKTIGYMTYFYNFSSFKGHRCLYLEDLFVYPEYRGHGYGKSCFHELARIAKKEKCERIDWVCLSWNTNAQKFYESMGAKRHDEWLLYRLNKNEITSLAKKKD
jgi:GNAT superfamily N-acetyltransferase